MFWERHSRFCYPWNRVIFSETAVQNQYLFSKHVPQQRNIYGKVFIEHSKITCLKEQVRLALFDWPLFNANDTYPGHISDLSWSYSASKYWILPNLIKKYKPNTTDLLSDNLWAVFWEARLRKVRAISILFITVMS